MNIYIYILWLIYINLLRKRLKWNEIILLLIFPMFLSLATQVEIGTDYRAYKRIFEENDYYSRLEPGFIIFVKFLKQISNNSRILFVTVSFIQSVFLYLNLKLLKKLRYINNIPIYILILFTSTNIYSMMFNGLRSSIASLMFTYFYLLFFCNKRISSFLFLIVGGSFHSSIYYCTFFCVILKKIFKRKYSIYIIYSYLTICFLIYKFNINEQIIDLIYNSKIEFHYSFYLNSKYMKSTIQGFGLAAIVNFFIHLIGIKYYKKVPQNMIMIHNLGIFSTGLRFVFYGMPILNRALECFNMFEALVIYYICKSLRGSKKFYIGEIIVFYYILELIVSILRGLKIIQI